MKRYILLFGILSIILTLFICFFLFEKIEPYRYAEITNDILVLLINIPFIIGGTLIRLAATAIGKIHISVPIVVAGSWIYYVWEIIDLYDCSHMDIGLKMILISAVPIALMDILLMVILFVKRDQQ